MTARSNGDPDSESAFLSIGPRQVAWASSSSTDPATGRGSRITSSAYGGPCDRARGGRPEVRGGPGHTQGRTPRAAHPGPHALGRTPASSAGAAGPTQGGG